MLICCLPFLYTLLAMRILLGGESKVVGFVARALSGETCGAHAADGEIGLELATTYYYDGVSSIVEHLARGGLGSNVDPLHDRRVIQTARGADYSIQIVLLF